MAWRIHDNVTHGEIDNRERGWVRGKLWLHGHSEPILLNLKGNAAPDLAGCLLTFENPGAHQPLRAETPLAWVQQGTIGELTASRKVRVLEVPLPDEGPEPAAPLPEHLANCLYLEWFSEANGRVVIESADYRLTISPPLWRLSPEEEAERQRQAATGFTTFLQKLSAALESQRYEPPADKEWDEFDYEKFMRECDARTDKYAELLDKYMDHPDRDRIIAQEMGWSWLEEALENDEPESTGAVGADPAEAPGAEEAEEPFAVEEPEEPPDLEPDPRTEGVDWVRTKEGYLSHPLALRALQSSLALWHGCQELGLERNEDEDLGQLISEYQITGAKLAGALDSLAYGRDLNENAFVVACLKRALNHLHAALAALEKVAPKRLLPEETLDQTRAELFEIREEILRLMEEFRGSGA